MSITRSLCALLVAVLLCWGIETVFLRQQNVRTQGQVRAVEAQKRIRLSLEHKTRERDLEQAFPSRKYLATGETALDRVFNTQGQSVVELIKRISDETIPNGWSCEV